MNAEYKNYLEKHKKEPFVMLDEMNLNLDQFCEKFLNDYSFRQMWKLECDFNYYDIRAGKCENAKVVHGKIFCLLKNCK